MTSALCNWRWRSRAGVQSMGLDDLIRLALFADRYEILEVSAAAQAAIVRSFLTVDTCGQLVQLELDQLSCVVSAARTLALKNFEAVARSKGFLDLREDALCDLVRDDMLAADEDAVLEAVIVWIKGGHEERRGGERLLGQIRYGLMEPSLLKEVGLKASKLLPGVQGACLRDLVDEALQLQLLPVGMRQDGACKSFVWRKGINVLWGEYAKPADLSAGQSRYPVLVCANYTVHRLCGSQGRVFCALWQEDKSRGSVILWDQQDCQGASAHGVPQL